MDALRAALERAVELGEVGIQVAAYRGEELLVDSWIGAADPDTGRPVDGDTLFPVIAVTKAITLTALHLQAERGAVEYSAPVAEYWPEFAAGGKADVTIRDVLTHRPGIVTPELTPEQLEDWEYVVDRLADAPLVAVPGQTSIYSGYVQGFVLAEVVRRTDPARRPFGAFVRAELCLPIGIDDVWLGLPDVEQARVARLMSGASLRAGQVQQGRLRTRVVPPGILPAADLYNQPAIRRACIPPSGRIMTARAGARFFALLANGGELVGARLLSEKRLRGCTVPREHDDEVSEGNNVVAAIGMGGYWIAGSSPFADPLLGGGKRTLGIGGQWRLESAGSEPKPHTYLASGGGSIGWADLDTRLAVMICHNRMFGSVEIGEHPLAAIAEAVRALAA